LTAITIPGVLALRFEPAAGAWVETYSVNGANAVFDYTLVLFPGDSVHAVDGLDPLASPKAVGTWSRAGDGVRATSSCLVGGGTYSLEGTPATASTALTGSWGAGENPTGGGGLSVQRQ